MNEHDSRLMVQYGITSETKMFFFYDGYRYERLADAVSYAKLKQAPENKDDHALEPREQI